MSYESEAISKAEIRIHELELHVRLLQQSEEHRKDMNKELRRGAAVLAWVALWCAWIILLTKFKTG